MLHWLYLLYSSFYLFFAKTEFDRYRYAAKNILYVMDSKEFRLDGKSSGSRYNIEFTAILGQPDVLSPDICIAVSGEKDFLEFSHILTAGIV